jgi:hypothetical protein
MLSKVLVKQMINTDIHSLQRICFQFTPFSDNPNNRKNFFFFPLYLRIVHEHDIILMPV